MPLRLTLVASLAWLASATLAHGQSDDNDPWSTEPSDTPEDSPPTDSSEEPPSDSSEEPPSDTLVNEGTAPAPAEISSSDESVNEPAEPKKPESPKVEYGKHFRPGGIRIAAYGTGTGVSAGVKAVVGSTGGTTSGFISAGYTHTKWGVVVGMPFAHHRTPGLRFDNTPAYSNGLGNLTLDGFYVLNSGKVHSVLAIETHFNVGSHAYTWVNDGDELWPGFGIDVAWQGATGDKLVKLYRLAMGLHGAKNHQPYPGFFPRFSAAFGLDYSFGKRVGMTSEAVLSYWDTSPLEINTLMRVDLLDGLRVRTGLVLPIATWTGLVPADQDSGLNEATFVMDMRYAF